jgi:ubiquinone/menaquinone biosynthesis C-methylase UbiE
MGALAPLSCPPNDVEGLAKALRSPDHGQFDEVICLINKLSYEVTERICDTLDKATPHDLILIYYSGHGKLDTEGNLYLATTNTRLRLYLTNTAVSISFIRELIRLARSQRIALILDCCFSGAAQSVFKSGVDDLLQRLSGEVCPGRGICLMTASTAAQVATERAGDSYSLFTKHLIDGIETGAADSDRDGVITVNELFRYTRERVSAEANEQHSRQDPMLWEVGVTEPIWISRALGTTPDDRRRREIQALLHQLEEQRVLPQTIAQRARRILALPPGSVHGEAATYQALLTALWQKNRSLDEFIDAWYRVELQGLVEPGPVDPRNRWSLSRSARLASFDVSVPAYFLDQHYKFLDWNPAFNFLIARPLGLVRGRHVEDWILSLENVTEVIERSLTTFTPTQTPLVDMEALDFRSPSYGRIRFKKVAAQLCSGDGSNIGWCVTLNIAHADREDLLWKDLDAHLRTEINWSKYASAYDQLLTNFDAYNELISSATEMIADSRRCADLGAGTGNVCQKLLDDDPTREVWAFEMNAAMLGHLQRKLPDRDDRLFVINGDLMISLREFKREYFDAAIMINSLYAIDDPARCLQEIYRILRPGGQLVLSTSHCETDLDHLFSEIRRNLLEKNLLRTLRRTVDYAYSRNREMEGMIHRDSKQDVLRYIADAGFEVQKVVDPAYAKAVILVHAIRP